MGNLIYVYVVVALLLWLTGITLITLIVRFIQSRNKLNKPKYWAENTKAASN